MAKVSIYRPVLRSGLSSAAGSNTLVMPYNAGDVQADFDTTAGKNVLVVEGRRGFILVDDTDTFTVAFGAGNITITWHSKLLAIGDTDSVAFVFNLFSTSGGGITADSEDTLTNKTIDGDDNTIQDLVHTSVMKTVVGNANKVDGYDGSGVPTLVATAATSTANALAKMDGSGKLSANMLPSSVVGALVYQSGWNANTNSPTIPAAASGNKGHYYVVTTAGTTEIDGVSDWAVGDWLVSNGTTWDKIDNSEKPWLLNSNNLSDVNDAAAAFTNIKQAATDTASGVVELATNAEVATGTDTTRAVTPAGMAQFNVYDISFSAGFDATLTASDIAVQKYGQLVMARSGSFTGEAGYIDTAGTGQDVIVDVKKNGTSIYTALPEFAAAANALTAGTLKSDGTQNFVAGDRISFEVTQVGSGTVGAGLRFTLKGKLT